VLAVRGASTNDVKQVYVKKATWSETMIATRAHCGALKRRLADNAALDDEQPPLTTAPELRPVASLPARLQAGGTARPPAATDEQVFPDPDTPRGRDKFRPLPRSRTRLR